MKNEGIPFRARLRPDALVPSRGACPPERGPTAPLPLPAAGPAPSPQSSAGVAAQRILLAHADPARQQFLHDELRAHGFEVVALDSGFEVLGNAQPWVFRGVAVDPPDAIVCSVSLPEWTGEDVLRILRAGDDRTPFVALVERSERASRMRLLAHGADAVASAAIDGCELAELVRATLRRREEASNWSQAA